MLAIKIKTIQKILTGLVVLNMAVLAVLCYNYYFIF